MSFVGEFRAFALKGNVIDLAVGVIIGGAFGKIVDAAVGDLIMPLVGLALGGIDFSSYYLPLAGQAQGLSLIEARKLGAVFAYGSFITVALNTRKSRPRHAYALGPMPPSPLAQPFLSLPPSEAPRWLRPGREPGGGESGQPRRAGVGREGKRMRFPTRRTHV